MLLHHVRHLLCFTLLLWGLQARAADREVRGKLVEVDVDDKSVVIEQENGRKAEYTIGADSKVHDTRGVSNFGFKDARLRAGATVRLVLPERGRTIKELHLLPAGATAPPKTEPQKSAARRTTPPRTTETTKSDETSRTKAGSKESSRSGDTSSRSSRTGKTERTTEATKDDTRSGREEKSTERARRDDADKDKEAPKGVLSHIIRIDKEKRTVEVELNDTKRKATYTLDKNVEFVGPRGGVSDEEFDDDRFVVGNQIRVEMEGRKVVRIHLPYRNRAKGDK